MLTRKLTAITASILFLSSFAVWAAPATAVGGGKGAAASADATQILPGVSAESIIVPGRIPPVSSTTSLTQQQLQLQAQELQLEQQILQIKQRLLQLQTMQAAQQNTTATATGNLKWVDAKGGDAPNKAIIGAYAKDKPLYICHANYANGTVHPGQLVDKGCLITYGGRALVQAKYQILTGDQRVQWKPANALMRWQNPPYWNAPIPLTTEFSGFSQSVPVAGGFENDKTLYICRAMFGDQIHLGKVVRNNCNIGIDGNEIYVQTYEVLFA